VEHILLGAPWNADGRPCLTILHRWVRHDKVEYHLYVLWLDGFKLVCEYIDNIELCDHHAKR
jgi:hypothetical protein